MFVRGGFCVRACVEFSFSARCPLFGLCEIFGGGCKLGLLRRIRGVADATE